MSKEKYSTYVFTFVTLIALDKKMYGYGKRENKEFKMILKFKTVCLFDQKIFQLKYMSYLNWNWCLSIWRSELDRWKKTSWLNPSFSGRRTFTEHTGQVHICQEQLISFQYRCSLKDVYVINLQVQKFDYISQTSVLFDIW